MNRPYIVNFSAIASENQLSIRASLSNSKTALVDEKATDTASPIESIRLFSKANYRIKIIGLNSKKNELFRREYDSDNHGKFEVKIPLTIKDDQIKNLVVYEISQLKGIEIHLGSYLSYYIKEPKKIIISDFDKTLVDTKYSTPKEMYLSLNRPLSFFPSVDSSIIKLKSYIDKGFQPFILSASPHFYENSIRDWLYQNQIFASNIILKDYRDFISIFDGSLSTKDIKKQGFYKLNKLIDILLMTKIPNELVLIGDGFESDPMIYLTLKNLLTKNSDPWKVWKSIKNHSMFNLNSKQDSYFITKFYQLSEMAKKVPDGKVTIYIRATEGNIEKLQEFKFGNEELTELNGSVNYYLN